MSGRMPSPRRARSPAAKSAPMKRVWQGASAAKRSKRASAAGSRSIADQRPLGAERSAIAARVAAGAEGAVDRGLPRLGGQQRDQLGGEDGLVFGRHQLRVAPASRVRGSSGDGGLAAAWSLISLGLRGGQALGDLGGGGVELLLLLGPGLGVPDLQVLAGADHDAGAVEAGVLDQRLGDADAPGGVELLVEGAAVEAAAQAARVLPKGLCGERKRSESCSNSAVVCTQTQGSKPLERTTPSARAARNRDGTVRRSLESRLCS